MAVNKRKVLDAARKYAQKGAKEKALKEYHTLLKLDPRDAKLHLEIGDCYRRWGQIDEAVTQYARVAEQYKGDGFDARAVAVFKQILNLDPKRYSAFVSLADLYQRMGLDAEALGALQAAADGYHKEGQKHEALDLLRKMATLDPTNTTSRLKVAELLRQEGMEEDAIAEYDAVAAELTKQGATESCLSVQEKILELQPDRGDVLLGIARGLLELKKPERAEPFARRAVEMDPEDSDPHEVLLEIHGALGNDTELAATTRQLAQVYRSRGDDDKARELTQRLPEAFQLDVGQASEGASQSAVDQTDSAFLSDDDLLDEDFLATDESDFGTPPSGDGAASGYEPEELETDDESDELLLDDDDDDLEDEPAVAEAEPPRPVPQGEPEQLFAEASVYLRYGKRDQAIASLAAVLEQEPEHRGALEKLGDAHAEVDESDQAVVYWTRAAKIAHADQDDEGFEVLRDRIAVIDAAAAAELGQIGPFEVDAESEADSDLGFEVAEIDLDTDESSASVPQPEVDDDLSSSLDLEDEGIELDLDIADDEDESEPEADQVEDEAPEEDDSADEDSEVSFDVDGLDADELSFDEDEDENDTENETENDAEDSDQARVAAEELIAAFDEEPDEEPSEGAAEVEFDAAVEIDIDLDGEDQDDVEPEEDVDEPVEQVEDDLAPDIDIDTDTDTDTDSDDAVEDEPKIAAADVSEDLEEAEFYYQQELYDEAEAIYRRVLQVVPGHPGALVRLGELAVAKGDDADRTEVEEVPEPLEEAEAAVQIDAPPAERPRLEDLDASSDETTVEFPAPDFSEFEVEPEEVETEIAEEPLAAAAESEDEGGMFDLAAELRDVIEETSAPDADVASALAGPSTIDDGFASIFSEFKQGVSATLSEDDYETRYDLGIAYREMELYADAIGEFQHCLESPTRKVTSLHMMGLCALDLGEAGNAANHLQQALASEELEEDHRAGLLFDLGRSLEANGDSVRARAAYESTLEADPDFPEAAARLAGVADAVGDETPELAGESEDQGFESFDDLMSNANDGMVSDDGESEHFETFDDVITGTDADLAEAEIVELAEPVEPEIQLEPEAELPRAPEAEPEATPEPPSEEPKRKRRKKISFV